MTEQQSGWQAPPVETGPAPGVEFAGYAPRLIGYIVDGIIVGLVTTVILVVGIVFLAGGSTVTVDAQGTVTAASVTGFGATIFFVTVLLAGLFGILYFPWFWARGGQTPGMRLTSIRVVDDRDGSRIGWGKALLRLVGWIISAAVFYIGFIWIFIDGRRRSWADLIAGTLVIKT